MTAPAPNQTIPAVFSRPVAVLILLCMGCAFAGNHIAARVAFDDGAGVLLAILLRSGGTLLVLAVLVLWQRQSLRLPPGAWRWQVLLGLLIA
ncbi:MAG: EamA/RhaT family transporter, partial [Pseudomonas sp.]